MKIIVRIVILILVFIGSLYAAFWLEEDFRKVVRSIYISSTNGKISFFIPRKYFHFASNPFMFSFAAFITILCIDLLSKTTKQRLARLVITLLIFVAATVVICWFDAASVLAACTACNDGTRQLRYGDINYDNIFITCLAVAIIPSFISLTKY